MDEKKKKTTRINLIKKHPHIVDEYFDKHVKDFFNTYFRAHGLNAKYNWYRIEFQVRGTTQIYGFCRFKSDVGISELAELVRDWRVAQIELNRRNLPCGNLYNYYLMPTRVKDDFVSDDMLKLAMSLEKFNRLLTNDEILSLKEALRVRI